MESRSEEKFESEDESVVFGMSFSFAIVAMRPRWDGVDTSVWKAVRSSWDAVVFVSSSSVYVYETVTCLIFRTALCRMPYNLL